MNKFYRRFKLTNKLSFIVVISILISFTVLGFYFDSFLKENDFQTTKKRMLQAYNRMSLNLLNTDNQLAKGTSFVQTDESILASIDLINNYQDKQNYNAILLDEEKKYIVSQLLNRVKLSLNNDIALYDANEELIAYVTKEGERYRLNFVSYENGKEVLFCKYEDEALYTKKDCHEYQLIYLKHKLYYEIQTTSQVLITYHLYDDEIYVKSHKNIFSQNNHKIIAHIEMSNIEGKEYFLTLSNALDMKITISTDKKYAQNSHKLLDRKLYDKMDVIQTDEDYSGAMSLMTQEGEVYLIATLEKKTLKTKLSENRVELFTLLFIVSTIILLLLRFIFTKGLSTPLKALMLQIEKIERRDYSQSKQLDTGDELEAISKNINTLAMTIRSRESQLQKTQNTLEYLSTHDSLTDLPNRRLFALKLKEAINIADTNKSKIAILFIDLDEFKEVNDSLGHDVGDKLLQEVAKRLTKDLRPTETFARIGGDEFYMLIENATTISEVKSTIEKVMNDFRSSFTCDGYEIKSTASIGAALYPDDGDNSVALIKNVDLAMYNSKDMGGNSFSFFSKNLSEQLEEKIEWIRTLREAVKTCDEFLLLYQPKISTKTGKIVAVEALVRWNSSKFGFVRPDQFITLAEKTKVIIELGKWILEQACSDFVKLANQGYKLEQISINVSGVQLLDSDMMRTLIQVIDKTGIEAHKIELEITESYIATNDKKTLQILQEFRTMGIGLAIDDFGTGFSSLSYLKKLPVTRLKIDKSFVDNIPDSADSVALVRVVVALAKTFNLQITAEGVENKAQLQFLQNIECDEIQGYYYSKPLSFDELKSFYDNGR